jgi:hypothetical protein
MERPHASLSRCERGILAILVLHAGLGGTPIGCAAPVSGQPPASPPAPPARVLVYYPPGSCVGELEIELFDRVAGTWRLHPEHARLKPGACAPEDPATLLNELRVRCIDPTGAWAPSDWVIGAELAGSKPACPKQGTDATTSPGFGTSEVAAARWSS